MRRFIIGLALLALAGVCTPVHASSEHGCIVYEDDAYICGTLADDGWGVDRTRPFVTGCIPEGYCDTDID